MKLASQIPPQTRPPAETVAILPLLLLKLMSAATAVPAEFSAIADSVTIPPWFKEIVEGVTMTWVATLLALVPLPPHPGRHIRKIMAATAVNTGTAGTRCMYPPRRHRRPTDAHYELFQKESPKCRGWVRNRQI
jgi:hypothetical protein